MNQNALNIYIILERSFSSIKRYNYMNIFLLVRAKRVNGGFMTFKSILFRTIVSIPDLQKSS